MHIPTTSKTLLKEIGGDARSPRWNEFVARYRPMMRAFLSSRYPSLAAEADDLIQETLVALVGALPDYRYVPGEQGAFHNYLTGILRNKAAAALRRRASECARDGLATPPEPPPAPDSVDGGPDEKSWREAVFEIALRQLLSDDAVQERTKQVFVRIAVNGEDPASVARAFGIERNAADQMKSRMMRRLKSLVAAIAMDNPDPP